jgi:poly-gamma-glutamate capsule biosynthesis protein CapA/YwtB (metallophosphatase superfamily)
VTYEAELGNVRIALTGDSIIHHQMSMYREPRFLALRERLRGADAALTSIETLFHDYEHPPAYITGGLHRRTAPAVIGDLRWLGFNLVAAANNHGFDFGEAGLLTHMKNLDEHGLPYAGIGANMAQARQPRYVDTAAGRIALIAATTSAPQALYAQHQWRDGRGRPGANVIRYTTTYTVDDEAFAALRRMRDKLRLTGSTTAEYSERSLGQSLIPDTDTEFYLGDLHNRYQYPSPSGYRIRLGDDFSSTEIPSQVDLEENLARIADARRMADWVIVSLHSHEYGETRGHPSQMAIDFAHAAIDAGADVFYGNGPARPRGLEIYRGRPIVYSVGMFFHQLPDHVQQDNIRRSGLDPWTTTPGEFYDAQFGDELAGEWGGSHGGLESPAIWTSLVVSIEFTGRTLAKIGLAPVELGFGRPRAQRGRPMQAEGPDAADVIKRFKAASERFGTEIDLADGAGAVRLPAS